MAVLRPSTAFRTLKIFAATLLLVGVADAIDARCSACNAVVEELFGKLNKEVPRNHLDLRHRLDPDGKRWGPVIEYRVSELRMIELLEDLCKQLEQYTLVEEEGGKSSWSKAAQSTNQNVAELARSKHQKTQLVNFCHALLEEQEDRIVAAIRGNTNEHALRHSLCHEWIRVCKPDDAPAIELKEEL